MIPGRGATTETSPVIVAKNKILKIVYFCVVCCQYFSLYNSNDIL